MRLTEEQGDIFDAKKNTSLAQLTNAEFRMNRGLARCFKEVLGEVRVYDVNVSDLVYVQHGNRYICHMVATKTEYERPTLVNVERCLKNLCHFVKEKKLKKNCISEAGLRIRRTGVDTSKAID